MKKKIILSVIIVLLSTVVILNILLAIWVPAIRLKWTYGFGCQTITTYAYPEYDRSFIVSLCDDILHVDAFYKDKYNVYTHEKGNGFATQDNACALSVNLETTNGNTNFTYLWVYARVVDSPNARKSIDTDGIHIDIDTYTINDKNIEIATCITNKSIGSTWINEQLQHLQN